MNRGLWQDIPLMYPEYILEYTNSGIPLSTGAVHSTVMLFKTFSKYCLPVEMEFVSLSEVMMESSNDPWPGSGSHKASTQSTALHREKLCASVKDAWSLIDLSGCLVRKYTFILNEMKSKHTGREPKQTQLTFSLGFSSFNSCKIPLV